MMRALALLALCALPLAAQTPPRVGDKVPNFTIGTVTADNATPTPVSLADFKGKTVVIAFFPKARTSGCTVQLQTYRDQYATMFNGGKDVVLIAISTDTPADLHAWAKDAKFPFRLGSDADGAVGTLFGAYMPANKMDNRFLAVIAPDGTVQHEARPFRAMGQDDYTALDAAIDRIAGVKK